MSCLPPENTVSHNSQSKVFPHWEEEISNRFKRVDGQVYHDLCTFKIAYETVTGKKSSVLVSKSSVL